MKPFLQPLPFFLGVDGGAHIAVSGLTPACEFSWWDWGTKWSASNGTMSTACKVSTLCTVFLAPAASTLHIYAEWVENKPSPSMEVAKATSGKVGHFGSPWGPLPGKVDPMMSTDGPSSSPLPWVFAFDDSMRIFCSLFSLSLKGFTHDKWSFITTHRFHYPGLWSCMQGDHVQGAPVLKRVLMRCWHFDKLFTWHPELTFNYSHWLFFSTAHWVPFINCPCKWPFIFWC